MNELVEVEKTTIPEVFKPGGTDYLVQKIKDQVTGLIPNVSTLKGRKEIASIAAKVSRSKTYIDGLGKNYVSELKAIPKSVDAERKRMRDALDELKETVRMPLTEWEAAEEARRVMHEEHIESITKDGRDAYDLWLTTPIQQLIDRREKLLAIPIDDSWEEYKQDAAKAKSASEAQFTAAIEKRENHDKALVELEKLRRMKAEIERKDRDEAMRREGEERIKRESEDRERAAVQAKNEAEQRERDAIAAGEIAVKNAEIRAENAKRAAESQAKKAAQDEIDRIENEALEEKREEKRRAANLQHRGKINRAAAEKLMELGLSTAKSKEVVIAIAKGSIPFVEIRY